MLTLPATGQIENHLILRKNNFRTRMNFLTGDPITLIREGNKYAEEFYLQGIGTDFIIVGGEAIPISKITCLVKNRHGFNFRASGTGLMLAAPGYLVIGAINNLFQGISLVPTPTNLIVAGSLLATGAILPKFQSRKYHLGKKFSLFIVQSDPMFNR
jgi:hypothetical protein